MYTLVGLWVLGKRAHKSPYLRKVLGVTRVLGYAMAVTVGVTAFTTGKAAAGVGEEGLKIGRDLEKVADVLGPTQAVTLNDQPIYFSQTHVRDPLGTVLDRFEANCNEDPALNGADWEDLADSKLAPTKRLTDFAHIGTIRKEGSDGHDGMVLCFRRREGTNQKTFTEAMEEFQATGDFAALGNLRYVHASIGDGETKVQTIWTNGSFNVYKLMPPDDGRDTQGSDSPNLPRPAHGQRLLTATAPGTPYSVRMYATGEARQATLDFYDQEMTNRGWAIITPPTANDLDGHWYERDGAQAMVSLGTNEDGKTVVTVGDLGDAEQQKLQHQGSL